MARARTYEIGDISVYTHLDHDVAYDVFVEDVKYSGSIHRRHRFDRISGADNVSTLLGKGVGFDD